MPFVGRAIGFIIGGALEIALINELLELAQAGLGKHIIEIGLLVAGVIGIAFFIFTLLKG
jgi:hypothetical protein